MVDEQKRSGDRVTNITELVDSLVQLSRRGIQRAAQTVLGVYLERSCSRVTSASSALAVLNDYALYKSTHSPTHTDRRTRRTHTCVWPVRLSDAD